MQDVLIVCWHQFPVVTQHYAMRSQPALHGEPEASISRYCQ
jgi:hypothetical protein